MLYVTPVPLDISSRALADGPVVLAVQLILYSPALLLRDKWRPSALGQVAQPLHAIPGKAIEPFAPPRGDPSKGACCLGDAGVIELGLNYQHQPVLDAWILLFPVQL